MKDPLSVPGVALLTLGVCVTERNQVGDADVYGQERIQDPQAIYKTKTEGQHKLSVSPTCENNKTALYAAWLRRIDIFPARNAFYTQHKKTAAHF